MLILVYQLVISNLKSTTDRHLSDKGCTWLSFPNCALPGEQEQRVL